MRRWIAPAALAVVAIMAAVTIHIQTSDIYDVDVVQISGTRAKSGVWYNVKGYPVYIQFVGRSLVLYVWLNTTYCLRYILTHPFNNLEWYYINGSATYRFVEIQQINSTFYRLVFKAPVYSYGFVSIYCETDTSNTAVKVKIP